MNSPKSRLNIIVKMIPTAATEVTFGSRIPIRHQVAPRSRELSIWASTMARTSCGTVATTNIPKVLSIAFQKSLSCISSL